MVEQKDLKDFKTRPAVSSVAFLLGRVRALAPLSDHTRCQAHEYDA